MKHLLREQAEANLRLGKPLEQWLERRTGGPDAILRWVRVEKVGDDEYEIALYEAVETERARYDIYGLYALEPDEDGDPQQVFGAAKKTLVDSAEGAISYVLSLGGAPDRFVNDTFVQQEYLSIAGD